MYNTGNSAGHCVWTYYDGKAIYIHGC